MPNPNNPVAKTATPKIVARCIKQLSLFKQFDANGIGLSASEIHKHQQDLGISCSLRSIQRYLQVMCNAGFLVLYEADDTGLRNHLYCVSGRVLSLIAPKSAR